VEQLFLSAAEVLGMRSAVRQGGLVNGPLRRLFGEPVDVVTGDYADERVDFSLPGVLPLELKRTYPGKMRVEGMLGPRWICSWSQRITINDEVHTALLEDAEGQRLVFAIGDARVIDARHLKAPCYHLTGTRRRMRLFDSRSQQFILFARGHDAAALEMVGIEDRNGNSIEFVRDGVGRLTSVRHTDGTVLRVETTRGGLLRALWLDGEAVPLVRYDYDKDDCLLSVVGAFTGEFHYGYSAEGWLNAWSDSGATKVDILYDDAGRVIGTHTGDGMFNDRFDYFPEARRSSYTDATGAMTHFHYDTNNLVTLEIDPLGGRTVSEWDVLERLQRTIDAAGRETRFIHDDDGRVIMETDWAGRTAEWTYDRWGALVLFKSVEGTTEWTRDRCGNVTGWKMADGSAGTAR
jgi:YD repeat-containing protein